MTIVRIQLLIKRLHSQRAERPGFTGLRSVFLFPHVPTKCELPRILRFFGRTRFVQIESCGGWLLSIRQARYSLLSSRFGYATRIAPVPSCNAFAESEDHQTWRLCVA